MPNPCPECRSTNGSCRQSVIGHPNPACAAGHPRRVTLSDALPDDMDGLELYIPAPRRSAENIKVR
jgi:hypothetical protein